MGLADIFDLLKKNGPRLLRLLQMVEQGAIGTNFSGGLLPAQPQVDVSGLRDDINSVSRAHAGLVRQMQDQTMQIAGVEDEVKRLRMSIEHSERRLEGVESAISSVGLWVKVLGGLSVALLVALGVGVLMFVLHPR